MIICNYESKFKKKWMCVCVGGGGFVSWGGGKVGWGLE